MMPLSCEGVVHDVCCRCTSRHGGLSLSGVDLVVKDTESPAIQSISECDDVGFS